MAGADDAKHGSGLRVRIAWAWLALLAAAAIWARAAGQGPIAWIETWYSVSTGSLLSANILILLLVLALPSVWVLFGVPAPSDPARQRALARRWAVGLFAAAGACLALATFGGVRAAMLPDGSEAAVPLTAERLARGDAPTQRVAIEGIATGDQAGFDQPLKNNSRHWRYRGFRPGGEAMAGNAPVALFVEESLNGAPDPPAFLSPETVEGYLIQGGLPDYARAVLERRGVRIAEPHYLLRDGEAGLRDDYYSLVLLGLIFAAIFGVIATLALLAAKGALPIRRPRR